MIVLASDLSALERDGARRLARTSVHESSHAVISHLLDREVVALSCVPSVNANGAVRGGICVHRSPRGGSDEARERTVMICLAGPCGDKRLTSRFDWRSGSSDLSRAASMLGSDFYRLAQLMRTTNRLVITHWPTIKELAKRLLVERELSGRDVRRIIAGRR